MDILRRAQDAVQCNIHACRDNRGVVYIFISDITDARNVYKIGMTDDIQERQRAHRTGCPRGIMAFYRYCYHPRTIETKLKNILAQQYPMSGEVVYDVPFNVLKNVIIFLIDEEDSNAASLPVPGSVLVPIVDDDENPPRRGQKGSKGNNKKKARLASVDEHTESFLYRNLPGGHPQKLGVWSADEIEHFKRILKTTEQPIKGNWGLLSRMVPTRVGYQCQSFYRKLVEDRDPMLKQFQNT